jgi:hypothetical protein
MAIGGKARVLTFKFHPPAGFCMSQTGAIIVSHVFQ